MSIATSDAVRKIALGVGTALIMMSPAGIERLKQSEGYSLNVYADPYLGWGKGTICYGHTLNVKAGDRVTHEQCQKWLKEDIASHCALVETAIRPLGITLSQGEQDAYCDLAFNTGNFKNTPAILGRLRLGDRYGACMGLLKYVYVGKTFSPGLYTRRWENYNVCISQLEVPHAF